MYFRYVFVLHYLNPDHVSFAPDVVIADGIVHDGGANITHCPSSDGCRAVVVTDSGAFVLDINTPTQTMTITVPDGKWTGRCWYDILMSDQTVNVGQFIDAEELWLCVIFSQSEIYLLPADFV